MPSKEPKNLMLEDKKDTPPAEDVRWEVSCNERTRESREQEGEISRHVKVIVSARTWVDAKERAFRTFASEHQIYEPEDVEAFVVRDAAPLLVPVPVPMTDAGAPPPVKEADDVPIRDEKGQLLSPMVIAATAAFKKDRKKKKAAKDEEETP